MFNKILGTFLSKGFVALISFGTLLLTTHNMGAQGRGDISIITTVVGIMGLVNGFVGGGTLVYIMPRHKNRQFFTQAIFLSLLWASLVCVLGTALVRYGYQIQTRNWEYVLYLGLLTCSYSILLLMILSNENINTYNVIGVVQPSLHFVFFAGAILLGYVGVSTFVFCLSLSYIFSLLIEIVIVKNIYSTIHTVAEKIRPIQTIKEMLSLGLMSQLGNVIQYLNYRFSYFIINAYTGISAVGIYSVGISIAESVWMLAQSISLVQYSTIANNENEDYAIALTIKLAKLSFIITLTIMSGIVLLPRFLFGLIFGNEFTQVRNAIIFLSPGIVILSFGMILSHYFAGKGLYHINTIASLIGLLISIPGCFIMIPRFGYIGAAIVASVSYFMIVGYQLLIFLHKTNSNLEKFKIHYEDFNMIIELFITVRESIINVYNKKL